MEKYIIEGNAKLCGEVNISGAKNAVGAILTAVVLCDEPCVIENIPNISDVYWCTQIFKNMGATVEMLNDTTIKIDATKLNNFEVPDELARHMRASYYFLGALLGRYKSAKVAMPGGCNFGVRPIDFHLKCFKELGAEYSLDFGTISLHAENLIGTEIYFDIASVGATINALLASVRADGLTIIENAAKEPHIVDLANFLNSMGANIMGAGTDVIKIRGVDRLHGTTYAIIPDQIEAGTFMIAAAATRGDVTIKNIIPRHLEPISSKLIKMGVTIEEGDDSIRVVGNDVYEKINVKTMPHPGFPTDMQPQMAVLLSLANGTSILTEGVWENRFQYIDELMRMGASITIDGRIAVIEGIKKFKAARVKATDLRAGAAFIIAALTADETSEIEEIHHIERGYENIQEKLHSLGANIKKVIVNDDYS